MNFNILLLLLMVPINSQIHNLKSSKLTKSRKTIKSIDIPNKRIETRSIKPSNLIIIFFFKLLNFSQNLECGPLEQYACNTCFGTCDYLKKPLSILQNAECLQSCEKKCQCITGYYYNQKRQCVEEEKC